MSAILPFVTIDSDSRLARYFTKYQMCWIDAEDPFHEAKQQVFALAEKSVRIGWTFCDGFKNVRKRLRFRKRDYLFVTKDYPSALEYMTDVYNFADLLGYTRDLLSHGEDIVKVNSLDPEGRKTSLSEEVKIGYIKFKNGSRIIAFSANPYAMAVYGGDVGLDEFAKHPNASLLWQTAQARVTWAGDLAVWSSHDGEDTLFNQFAQQARAACTHRTASGLFVPASASQFVGGESVLASRPPSEYGVPASAGQISAVNSVQDEKATHSEPLADTSAPQSLPSTINQNPSTINSPWNLYFRVTMPDAVELGVVDVINRTKDTELTPEKFLADCRNRSGSEEIYQQSYLCNPLGAATASIVEWSAIERCRYDYQFERLHLESSQLLERFGEFNPASGAQRQNQIHEFIHSAFPNLFASGDKSVPSKNRPKFRLGFDVAASGEGDLAAFYIDESKDSALWLRALLTVRTEDWHFLGTVLGCFLDDLPSLNAAGDESGLGRQICWEAAAKYHSRFLKVNFGSKKQDLGFALMNQLSIAEKRFPRSEQDIAADFFAIRKFHSGTRWTFTEGRNTYNPVSHCDIAWAGALATHAHTERRPTISCAVGYDTGWFDGKEFHPYTHK